MDIKRRKLAILGASDFQNPMILKAKEMGLETHAFAWECGDIGEKTADVFHPISIADKEDILAVCQKEGISGITTCGSDFAVVAQNFIADKAGYMFSYAVPVLALAYLFVYSAFLSKPPKNIDELVK